MQTDYDKLEAAIRSFKGEDMLGQFMDQVDINLYSQGKTLLHHAVDADNVLATTLLLSRGARVDAEDLHEETPLHLAKSHTIAALLLRRGACVKRRRTDGATPLHTCLCPTQMKLLLQLGAEVNAKTIKGETPLHVCKSAASVALLVDDGGADVNATNCNQYTPLHLASSFGRWQVVVALLERNASVDMKDHCGRTAMDIARAVFGIFAKMESRTTDHENDKVELVRTMKTLALWSCGRRKGLSNVMLIEELAWSSMRSLCCDPKAALTRILPLDLANTIVVEWLGPWSLAE
ncbi:hypothetical protein LEN26_005697 [Aphanomyces euteiches]|nr:hypothetical protein AeMF1_000294 [Aphanomyces euteiches]KAH9137552.1 hypothetical protein LEN26_005697 [Aphanomyces euteiches]KAH9196864.1 hypothetical protein AeNC1_001178 [Aphanomyces euteiches]